MSRRREAGFTLIELMVSLVISGILAVVIFQLIEGQGRFTSMQSAREEVQQNSRASLELIASELRAVPPEGITVAKDTTIDFRLPRTWGVVCRDLPAADNVAWIAAPAGTFPDPFPTNVELAEGTEWGLALESATPGVYDTATISAVASNTAPCESALAISAAKDVSQYYGFTVANLSNVAGASGARNVVGARAFLYQRVRYDLGKSSGYEGTWLRRRTLDGRSVPQPMAGPVVGSRGLSLTYFGTAGALAQPVTPAAVRRVQVKVSMESRNKKLAQDTDSLVIHLRSR